MIPSAPELREAGKLGRDGDFFSRHSCLTAHPQLILVGNELLILLKTYTSHLN